MSCGQIALKEMGKEFECYYASEIDRYAIMQTQLNFPETIQLGDINAWKNWNIEWSKVDLILAGSPCQGFSFAGKQLAFDDPRSRLFYTFIDILKHVRKYNPSAKFLLENVNMKKQHLMVINQMTGIFPVNINSALVSAQNRNRWYWTNIRTKMLGLFCEVYADIPQPSDENIYLKDILETEVDAKYYVSQAVIDRMKRKQYSKPLINPSKCGTLNTKNNSGQMALDSGTTFIKIDADGKIKSNQEKASCFTAGAHSGGNHSDMDLICTAIRGREACFTSRRTEYGKRIRKDYEAKKIKESRGNIQQLEPRLDGKTNCLTSIQKDNLILQLYHSTEGGNEQLHQASEVQSESGKMDCVNLDERSNVFSKNRIRRLTPTECARLQTIPDWYKWKCSETQQYKMLGNGWTVKVIIHILRFLD